MGRDTFLLLFFLGTATLAVWVVLCVPRLAPQSIRAAAAHIAVALLIGVVLEPAMRLVPGEPAPLSVLAALFGIALPAMTYMLLSGLWLLKLIAGHPLARS